MNSFDEFSHGLNKKPQNTRSSLIERGAFFNNNNNSSCDLCRRQVTSIGPENVNFELVNQRRKTSNPFKTYNQSEQQEMFEDSSSRNIQQTPFGRTYNYSGKPLHLSDLRNDMTSEHLFDSSNNSRTYGPTDSWISQRDATSNFLDTFRQEQLESPKHSVTSAKFYQGNDVHKKSELIPYDESGRTFNLTEFGNNSNNLQNLIASNSKQRRTPYSNGSSINFYVPPESLKASCRDLFQNPQCPPTEDTTVPRGVPQFQYGKNAEMNSTLHLHLPLQPVIRRNPLFETLVKDRYHPGIIVDTVNGLIDFNKIAFGGVFGCENIPLEIDPESVPMSLLEAFDLRIDYEQDLRDDLEKQKLFCSNEFKNEKKEATVEAGDDVQKDASKRVTYWTHRDELKLASTIDIDLMTKVANFPETPLTEAINCLLKAEKIHNFDRKVHLAEEAIRTASDGQQELAALKSTCSFKLNLRKDETKTTNSYEPLAIISYIGTTKPNDE